MTEALIRAAMNSAQQAEARRQPSTHPRYSYETVGSVSHFKSYASPALRSVVRSIEDSMVVATPDQCESLGSILAGYPRVSVPLKRAHLLERSRYGGPQLRHIRAQGGGAKERARAERRAEAMRLQREQAIWEFERAEDAAGR